MVRAPSDMQRRGGRLCKMPRYLQGTACAHACACARPCVQRVCVCVCVQQHSMQQGCMWHCQTLHRRLERLALQYGMKYAA